MEKHSVIHPLGVMSAVGFLLNAVYQVEDVFFYFYVSELLSGMDGGFSQMIILHL